MSTILAIETSCDETGIALLQQKERAIVVQASAVASQIDVHALTGGVVPDVAAREHTQVIIPLLQSVLVQANIKIAAIDAIAVTVGPGLMPALSVGVQLARTVAYRFQKPIVPVHHIEGHIYAALLQENEKGREYHVPDAAFPVLALIVSGGHTLLVYMKDHLQYETIGTTRDDAAGEAFDKVARLLELPYPGGPHLAQLATQGNAQAFALPRPMIHADNFDVSFSGLKTAVLYLLRDNPHANKADVAASFQQAVVDTVMAKLTKAVKQYQPQTVLLSGGVAANVKLRDAAMQLGQTQQCKVRLSPLQLCGDNAVMIGQAGLYAFAAGRIATWQAVDPIARVPLEQFS